MTRRAESTITTDDGLNLRRVTWLPDDDGDIAGLVVICHGLGEHVGRYENVAQALVAAGIAVTGADHRGHGRSDGLRGHVDGFSEYARDLNKVVVAFRDEHPDLQAVLFGHSMGGLISLTYNLDFPEHGLAGIAVSNPQLGLAFEPPKIKALAGRLLSRVLPRLRLGNELDTKHISRDPAEIAAYDNDPLVHGLVSTRWFTSMGKAMAAVNGAPERMTTPALFVLGGSDSIVSAAAGEAFARKLEPSRTTVKVWPDSYHEPHNDLDRDEVVATLVAWCKQRVSA